MKAGNLDALTVELRQRWAAARVRAAHQAPYLATALLALEPVVVLPDREDGVLDVDLSSFPVDPAWHVYLDPDSLAAADLPEVGFWLIHQVSHLLRHHAPRFPGEDGTDGERPVAPIGSRTHDQVRWNAAADAEINDDLCVGDLVVPASAVTPSELGFEDGLTAEQYWDRLPDVSAVRPAAADLDSSSHRVAAERGRAPEIDCGSGCDGQSRPWDCGRPGLSEVDRRLLERDVARRIRDHHRRRGDLPEGWQRWADEVLEPMVNWRRVLASRVRRGVADVAGRVDFTYQRPSRRGASVPGVVLPSLRRPLPQVAMVIDTSGSMSDSMLSQALGEVAGVLRSLGVGRRNLRVICCDAQAYTSQRVMGAKDVTLLGGGGTDMTAGLDAAAELRPRPDLVVVLTDGHTPWPPRPPDHMAVVVGLMDRTGDVPAWARAITIEPAGSPAGW